MQRRKRIGFMAHWPLGGYYGDICNGAQQVAHQRDAQLLVIQEFNYYRLKHQLPTPPVAVECADGWIITAGSHSLQAIRELGLPLVVIGEHLPDVPSLTVLPDNHGGMFSATEHLIEHGHQRIGFVTTGHSFEDEQRFAGYKAALEKHSIDFDPAWLIDLSNIHNDNFIRVEIYEALRQRAQTSLPFTACVTNTDSLAFQLMKAFQDAGLRIPEDIAVTGFDDNEQARHAQPPLTTVRQPVDQLGSIAATLLLAQLRGEQPPPITYAPTGLIVRQSCGCSFASAPRAFAEPVGMAAQGWQNTLARRLVETLYFPYVPELDVPLEQVWPGVGAIVQALEDSAHGGKTATSDIEAAIRYAVSVTIEPKTLRSVIKQIEQAVHQIAAQQTKSEAQERLSHLLDFIHISLLHAYQARVEVSHQLAKMVLDVSDAISQQLKYLNNDDLQSIHLDWLSKSPMPWGCLGTWVPGDGSQYKQIEIVGSYHKEDSPHTPRGRMLAAQHFPPLDEWDEAAWPTPHTIAVFPIWTDVSDWGLLALALPSDIDFPAFTSLWLWFGLLGVGLDYYSARKTLLQQQEDLKQSYSRERVLSETIRELGAPVIQLSSRAVLVPLVGAIDSERAMHITDRVLATVHTLNARTVVLDLSGVPIVDTQVAAALMSLAKSVSLLGSSVAIVGVRPEIAQSIVGLGIDFRSFATYASLSNALSALRN